MLTFTSDTLYAYTDNMDAEYIDQVPRTSCIAIKLANHIQYIIDHTKLPKLI